MLHVVCCVARLDKQSPCSSSRGSATVTAAGQHTRSSGSASCSSKCSQTRLQLPEQHAQVVVSFRRQVKPPPGPVNNSPLCGHKLQQQSMSQGNTPQTLHFCIASFCMSLDCHVFIMLSQNTPGGACLPAVLRLPPYPLLLLHTGMACRQQSCARCWHPPAHQQRCRTCVVLCVKGCCWSMGTASLLGRWASTWSLVHAAQLGVLLLSAAMIKCPIWHTTSCGLPSIKHMALVQECCLHATGCNITD